MSTSKKTVHVGVYDTMADWEVGHATAHLRSGRFHREPGGYEIVTVGLTTEPVTSMGGLRLTHAPALDRLAAELGLPAFQESLAALHRLSAALDRID